MDLVLETQRLILRKPVPGDASALAAAINDPRIAATTLNIPHPYSVDDALDFINRTNRVEVPTSTINLAVFIRETDELIGGTGLLGISGFHSKAEIGYWCAVAHWNRGYTTEAAKRLVEYGFSELGLERIYAHCFATNPASARVMEKIGMKFEGTARHEYRKDDQFVDFHHYAIIRKDRE